MKTLVKICLVSLFSLALASFNSRERSISFEQALADKKIEMEILPYDTYPGKGIRISVKNLTSRPLNLEMATGTIFIPDSDPEQTLVKSAGEMLALDKNEEKTIQFHGYCTEFHDRGPDRASTFRMSRSQNASLISLLSFMDSLNIRDQSTIQHSIWCITDSATVARVGNDDPSSKALRNYICSVTGQKDTWYSTATTITETPEHVFVVVPKEIKGQLSFTAGERVELQGTVRDSSGNVIVTNPNKMTCPPGKIKFEFKLKIEGWQPGNYSVVYMNNGVEVINQPFSI